MDIKHLRIFVAAVEEGSIQAASRLLNIAQPALSRRIRDLEDELGCTLLVRGGKGVTPTQAGLALYRDALGIIEDHRGMATKLDKNEIPSSFAVAANEAFAR